MEDESLKKTYSKMLQFDKIHSDIALMQEPYKTFNDNTVALNLLKQENIEAIEKAKKELLHDSLELTKQKKNYFIDTRESTRLTKEIRGTINFLKNKNFEHSSTLKLVDIEKKFTELHTALEEENKKFVLSRNTFEAINRDLIAVSDVIYLRENQKHLLFRMFFIYLVAIWEAFIFDTARKILNVHPQLLSESQEPTKLTKSILWNSGDMFEVRNYLIDEEIRRLDFNKMALVREFNDYWGINWGDSGVSLDEVLEIRGRRDLWVHSKGIINQQYLNMVRKHGEFKLGQLADINEKYYENAIQVLSKLSSYIQIQAYYKHYSPKENIKLE